MQYEILSNMNLQIDAGTTYHHMTKTVGWHNTQININQATRNMKRSTINIYTNIKFNED